MAGYGGHRRFYASMRRIPEERHIFHGSSFRARLNNKWRKIQASFWFIPSLMSVFSFGLAVFLVHLDANVVAESAVLSALAYSGSAAGASDVLTLVASSMVGIAGVTFSITIVALTLASGHFGPRLLRNFMKDFGNQVVLGTYISTFVYCLWVIQTIRAQQAEAFVPGLSVTGALVLALAGLSVLIFFFHHVSTAIQAGHVIADAYGDLVQAVERHLFDLTSPEDKGDEERDDRLLFDEELAAIRQCPVSTSVPGIRSGYVQAIDYAYLLSMTKRLDGAVELHVRAGDFLVSGCPVLTVYGEAEPEEDLERTVNYALFIGGQKTAEQDIEYSLDQLVEIAVRALSPGVNDPGTAITCVDYLAAALAQASQKQFPSGLYRDEDKTPRVFARRFTFAGMFDAAFRQIRQNAAGSVAVYLRLLEVFGELAPLMRTEEQEDILQAHAEMVFGTCQRHVHEQRDLDQAQARYSKILIALQRSGKDEADHDMA